MMGDVAGVPKAARGLGGKRNPAERHMPAKSLTTIRVRLAEVSAIDRRGLAGPGTFAFELLAGADTGAFELLVGVGPLPAEPPHAVSPVSPATRPHIASALAVPLLTPGAPPGARDRPEA